MRVLLLIPLVLAGCLRTTEFRCDEDTQCSGGRCEPQGYCSFFDPACDGTQQRFGDSAGSLSNVCVTPGGGDVDAGNDAPPGDAPPVTGCPSGYAEVPGATPGRRYQLLATPRDWLTQRDACAATSSSAYLFIPDNAEELLAIRNELVQVKYWLGIDDRVAEGVFQNSKLEMQTFLPWAPGEPDDNMGGQDCVAGLGNGTQISTERCGQQFPAVCECEP
jgi:hypothetical protein